MSLAHTRSRKRRSYKALQFVVAGFTAMAVANAIIEMAAPLTKQRIKRSRIKYVATPEGDICTQIVGDSPTALLIHDLKPGASNSDYSDLFSNTDGASFIGIDLLGYGRSDRPQTAYSIGMHTDHVVQVLTEYPSVTKIISSGYAASIALQLVQRGIDIEALIFVEPEYGSVGHNISSIINRVPIVGPFIYHVNQILRDSRQSRVGHLDDRFGNIHRVGSANVAHGPELNDLCESLVMPMNSEVHVFHIDPEKPEHSWNAVRGIAFG